MYKADSFSMFSKSRQPWGKKSNASTGALLPESATRVFWLYIPNLPEPVDIHAVEEGTLSALPAYIQRDYTLAIAPFELGANKCAVIQDASGRRICLVEKTGASD